DAIIFSYGAGGYGFGLWNDGRLYLTKVNVDSVSGSTVVTDVNPHHVAVSKSGQFVTFYVDGVAQPSIAYGSAFSFTTPVAIGARADNLNNGFWGRIDELSVYNRALSIGEIQGIYNAQGSGKCAGDTAPFIFSQPVSQTITGNDNVTFNVIAGGKPSPT